MLIPSIDLMGGRIVQLVQGERKALEFADFDPWIERFESYPIVQLIDLDAAMGRGSNRELLPRFTTRLNCQVGGGIRNVDAALEVLAAGARKVIVGSALVQGSKMNTDFAQELANAVGTQRIIAALDSRGGKVATRRGQAIDQPPTSMEDSARQRGSCRPPQPS